MALLVAVELVLRDDGTWYVHRTRYQDCTARDVDACVMSGNLSQVKSDIERGSGLVWEWDIDQYDGWEGVGKVPMV